MSYICWFFEVPKNLEGHKRGRKRYQNEASWSRNKRKLLRNSGRSCVTTKNKLVAPKHLTAIAAKTR